MPPAFLRNLRMPPVRLGPVISPAEIQLVYVGNVMAGRLIAVDDPGKPDVRALLERHRTFALGQTPPEHSFALDADALRDPGSGR